MRNYHLVYLFPLLLASCDKDNNTSIEIVEPILAESIVIIPQENAGGCIGYGQVVKVTTDVNDRGFTKQWSIFGNNKNGDTVSVTIPRYIYFKNNEGLKGKINLDIIGNNNSKTITTDFAPQHCDYRYGFWGQKDGEILLNESANNPQMEWKETTGSDRKQYCNNPSRSMYAVDYNCDTYYFDDENKLYRGYSYNEYKMSEGQLNEIESNFQYLISNLTEQFGVGPDELNILYNFRKDTIPLTEYNLTYRKFIQGYIYQAKWITSRSIIKAEAYSPMSPWIRYSQIFEKK